MRIVTLFTCLTLVHSVAATAEDRPNIVFVLADDLGWSELGCYGNRFNETPHIDSMAAQGMRFTHAYAAAPVCSPYRAALLTGQHPARVGILDYLTPNSANALSTQHITLPEMLKKHGYSTGMIGKWHLTGYKHHAAEFEIRPTDHGFDWNFGSEVKSVGNGANFWPYVFRKQPIRWLDIPENQLGENEYLTDRLNAAAVEFIENNRKQPFFLYVSHYAPHTILNGKSDLVEKYVAKHPPGKSTRDNCYLCEDAGLGKGDPGHHWAGDHNPHLAAMVESIDHGIGLIDAKLKELGIAENTIVIFTSDNGGETNVTTNAPLRGGKSQLYEGGIRVPMIVRWPRSIPAGSVCGQPTQNTDFYPTLLEAADIQPPTDQKLDGASTLTTWKNPQHKPDRDFIAWHYPLDKPHFLGGVSAGAIRSGNWKLIEFFDSGASELYSLTDDPGEQNNLASKHPEVLNRLRTQLTGWRTSLDARIPSPPLLVEPRQLYFAEHFNADHLSQRLWYNANWRAESGVLKRIRTESGNTRIFLRDAKYKNALIRFDFKLGDARDVRLMTGSGGHYNTVLHLRPDHFFLQTAKDASVPWFALRHSECAFEFDPNRWYTMTLEFNDDEAIAHIDHDHLVRAKHPIIDRTREYFAIQVDEHAAEFDNIQILNATAAKSPRRQEITTAVGRHPVEHSIRDQYAIRKTNAHGLFHLNDKAYRHLVKAVDDLDEQRKKAFPDAFRSHKEYKKRMLAERKRLNATDTKYKQALRATHLASRAVDKWLLEQKPELNSLPSNRKKAAMAQLRQSLRDDPQLLTLTRQQQQAETNLVKAYPHLFVSDETINAKKKAAADTARNDPEFKRLNKLRAEAYRAQQQYLVDNDAELRRLEELLKRSGK